MLAALQGTLKLVATSSALQTENYLLCGLCLLVENGLSLTTKTLLLTIVTTFTYLKQTKNKKVKYKHQKIYIGIL